jgi:hypothetical protein
MVFLIYDSFPNETNATLGYDDETFDSASDVG